MVAQPDYEDLVRRFDAAGVLAIALMGSCARGDAGSSSDVDLLRLIDGPAGPPGAGSYLIDGRLVVVSDAGPGRVEEWFTRPEVAVTVIAGLRAARPLLDRQGALAAVQRRARAFVWDAAMQAQADAWASREMAGWIEEVHKGLEGLRRGDVGRLLNARFGLSWGLTRVMQVQRGVLLEGDNAFYGQVAEAVGSAEWVRLRRMAFGIEGDDGRAPSLAEQVAAGLRLYGVTADLLAPALQPADAPLIAETVALIGRSLAACQEAVP